MGQLRKGILKRSQTKPHRAWKDRFSRWLSAGWLSAGIVATMMAISTVVVAAELPQRSPSSFDEPPPARTESIQISQRRIRRKDIWREVQKQLPELPLENQYISSETGDINESNTLVRRMIEYHNFRKGRAPSSRFDWKLTLADYLGLHEVMSAENYPSARRLRTNPLVGDRTAIQSLNRQQRQQLINTLVSLYDPRIPAAFFTSPTSVEAIPTAEPSPPLPPIETSPTQPSPPPLSGPGAADLLRPRN